jgi:HEAT repeat protein
VPELTGALKNKDVDVRRPAAFALGSIGPAAADAVPALAEALKDQDEDVRIYAAAALRWIGPAAADAVPALIETLKDNQDDPWSLLSQYARGALEEIPPSRC